MSTPDVLERIEPVEPGPIADSGRAWLEQHGLPTTGLEAWKRTPVDDLVSALLDRSTPETTEALGDARLAELVPDLGGPRIVHVNGRFVPELSRLDDLAAGLTAVTTDAPEGDEEPADGFQALNWLAGRDVAGYVLEADSIAGSEEQPLQIVHVTTGADTALHVHPRTHVRVGERSNLDVVEYHVETAGASLTNAATTITVADSATITHRRIVFGTDESLHVGRIDIHQGDDSAVRSTAIAIDGAIVRTGIRAVLGGDRAHLELDGLFAPIGRQRHDNVVTVEHAGSDGYSSQVFKGIVAERGRGSFLGHVIVHKDTANNDARQSNPNLILDRTAQVDTNPWLEIYADEVACVHGATIGRLDEDALFYLRSRGIPEEQARAVLLEAFAGEVISHLEPAPLREHVEAIIAERTPGGLRLEP